MYIFLVEFEAHNQNNQLFSWSNNSGYYSLSICFVLRASIRRLQAWIEILLGEYFLDWKITLFLASQTFKEMYLWRAMETCFNRAFEWRDLGRKFFQPVRISFHELEIFPISPISVKEAFQTSIVNGISWRGDELFPHFAGSGHTRRDLGFLFCEDCQSREFYHALEST